MEPAPREGGQPLVSSDHMMATRSPASSEWFYWNCEDPSCVFQGHWVQIQTLQRRNEGRAAVPPPTRRADPSRGDATGSRNVRNAKKDQSGAPKIGY